MTLEKIKKRMVKIASLEVPSFFISNVSCLVDSFSVKDRLVKVFLRLQGFETNLDRFNHLDIFHFAVVLPYILPLPLSFHHHH